QVSGGLSVNSADAVDIVIQNSQVDGATTVQTGSGADALIANRNIFSGFTANTGVGNDLVAFYANTVRAALSAVTSGGQDTIGLRQANDFQASAVFNGAGGVDTLASDGSGAAPAVVAVENNNNAVLDGLIDDVLADFDDLSLDI
ncbi:MAG: hypothetical protein NXI04_28965, partial [Planctomycetaceae bacterium]|nr:hypothetical protein [Planctomycetaceae bacterium]